MRAHLLCNNAAQQCCSIEGLLGQVKGDFSIDYIKAFEWCTNDHENNGVFENQHCLPQITPCSHGAKYARIYTYICVYTVCHFSIYTVWYIPT